MSDRSTLTEHSEIGVSLAAILKINLCQECRFRLRRSLAGDIRRLEIMRAHMAGEIAGIDSMLESSPDCTAPPPSRQSTLIAENIVREWRPPLDQAAVPLVLAIAAALDEAIP